MVFDDRVADISRSRTMTAPPQAIWDILADFGSLSSWVDDVDHSCVLTRGPDGAPVGSTRRVQMGRTVLVERMTTFDPVVALGYDVEGLPRRLRHVANQWTLRPAGDGTEVTVTSTVEIGTGPVAGAAEWAACRAMAKMSESMLAGLARRTEKSSV